MKIVLYPDIGEKNKYIEIISEGLRDKGFEIVAIHTFFSKYRDIQIIHLNWFDEIASRTDFIKKTVKLILYRLLGAKIVWTLHNKVPHENKHALLQRYFNRLMVLFSSKIIIHSQDSRVLLKGEKTANKTVYLPHPNYIDLYGPFEPMEKQPKAPGKPLKLLFIGQVRPYKNIELLIECCNPFGDQIHLTIAGGAIDHEYEATIRTMADTKNITLDLNFIADIELAQYLMKNDLVVLPYDLKSSLNSGSVLLCFSYGKTVICPNIGTINDIKDKRKLLNYTYDSAEAHKKILTEKVRQAIQLKTESPGIFSEWGLSMRNYVSEHHDKEKFVNELASIYSAISN